MLKDIYSAIEIKKILDAIVVSASQTSMTSIDLKNYVGAAWYVNHGLNGSALDGSNYYSLKLQESDDDSTWTDVAAADVICDGVATDANVFGKNNAAADDNAIHGIGYRGTKRYVRPYLTVVGTVSTPVSVFAMLEPDKRPATRVQLAT